MIPRNLLSKPDLRSRPGLPKPVLVLFAVMVGLYALDRFLMQKPLGQTLARLVASYADDDGFSGVVLVVAGDDTLLHAAYGLADPATRRSNTPHTRFPVGDISQLFTRGAVALLAAEGRLDPDSVFDRIGGRNLPHAVTLRQLLNHRSGLADAYVKDPRLAFEFLQNRPIDKTDLIRRLTQYAPDSTADADRQYGRTGPALAALALDGILPEGYDAFVQEMLLRPLGMAGASVGAWGDTLQLAVGQVQSEGQWMSVLRPDLSHYPGAADGVMTANDLARWRRVQTLLPDDSLTQSLLGRQEHYGRLVGCRTAFWSMPSQALCVVILSNRDPAPVEDMAQQLATLVLRRRVIELPPDSLSPFVGQYQGMGPDGLPLSVFVTLEESHLSLDLPGEDRDRLHVILRPVSPRRFLTEFLRLNLNLTVDFSLPGVCYLDLGGPMVTLTRDAAQPEPLYP